MGKGHREKALPRGHYVPQSTQRRFSNTGDWKSGGHVATWDKAQGTYRDAVSIRNHLQEAGYYEREDRGVERHLSRLEGNIAEMAYRIRNSRQLPEPWSRDHEWLCLAGALQLGRTGMLPATVARVEGEVLDRWLHMAIEREQDPEERAALQRAQKRGIRREDRTWARGVAIRAALQAASTLMDPALALTLLYSPNHRMILPEEGAWAFNWLADDMGQPGWVGLGAMGAGLVLPLSSEYTVIWWDCHTYRWAREHQGGPRDRQEMTPTMERTLAQSTLAQTKQVATMRHLNDQESWIGDAQHDLVLEARHEDDSRRGLALLTRIPGLERNPRFYEHRRRKMAERGIREEDQPMDGPPLRPTVAGAADEYRAIMGEEPPRRGKHGRSCRTDCTTGIAGSG